MNHAGAARRLIPFEQGDGRGMQLPDRPAIIPLLLQRLLRVGQGDDLCPWSSISRQQTEPHRVAMETPAGIMVNRLKPQIDHRRANDS